MSKPISNRDTLFRIFGRAFFKKDTDLLYSVVTEDFTWSAHEASGLTRVITGKAAVTTHMNGQSERLLNIRFHDAVYHHGEDASFMTFRLTANHADTNEPIEELGIERYTFRGGRIATKDVYRKYAVN